MFAKKLFGLGKNLKKRLILVDWQAGRPVCDNLADA
jgi:hypothetical protein